MQDTIVTAIYYSPYTSRMGGRGYTFEYYENPFKNLLSLDLNIVVFTHGSESPKIESFFQKNKFTNYKIIEYDLNNYMFSDKIYDVKEKKSIIDQNGLIPGNSHILNDRNTHLCLSKMDFLKMTIDGNYFLSANYYWIDAGLFHNGLFPNSLGGMERYVRPNDATFWPRNQKNLCKPGLIDNLQKTNKAKLLFVGLTNSQAIPSWWNRISDLDKQMHVIGGIFGGDPNEILAIYPMFKKLAEQVFYLGEITLEEDLLTVIVSKNKLNYLKFDTWYHDVPTDSCYCKVDPNQKSFYKIFRD